MIYTGLLKPILFRFDPESVHDAFISIGEWAGNHAVWRSILDAVYEYHGPDISKMVDGIKYRTPFLLSAGFDYNGRLSNALGHIGLGGEEVGSVTARPCAGNPAPRLTRLPRSRSILVNKGLKNEGVDAVIVRLKDATRRRAAIGEDTLRRPMRLSIARGQQAATRVSEPAAARSPACNFVIGISIARTNNPASVPVEAGIADYLYSFQRLNEEGVGDYYTINISCPNAFGGEAFTDPRLLDRLLSTLQTVRCAKPVYVKMPINIPWDRFEAILKIIDTHGLNGVVIGNLNKDYDYLDDRDEAPRAYKGGLSGRPCAHPSTGLILKTRETFGKRFTIIGVGGVMSPETMREKFDAGADLVQLISGLIFEGPGLVKKLCVDYERYISE